MLDSSTSHMVRIAHRWERSQFLASPCEPWGLVMCVLDLTITCLTCDVTCTTDANASWRGEARGEV